ncbi:hypothetical protein MTO96_016910 [Rhipicephalus appendiculatus]
MPAHSADEEVKQTQPSRSIPACRQPKTSRCSPRTARKINILEKKNSRLRKALSRIGKRKKPKPSASAQYSENSDSDSESSEDEAPKAKTTPAAPPKQEAVQSKDPAKRVKPETNSFGSSDSEAVAPPSKKPAVPTPALKAVVKKPQQSKKPQDRCSDPPSDNDAYKPPPAKKRATVKTTPKAQNAASSAKKAAAKRDESSSSNSSDECEPQKQPAVMPRSAATPPIVTPKATPAKPQKDYSDSSPESEDDQHLKKIARPQAASAKKTLKIVNQKPPVTFVIRQDTAHPASPSSRHVHSSQIKPSRHVLSYANVSKTFSCAGHYDHETWSPRRGWDVRCQPSRSASLPCPRTDGSTRSCFG